MPLRNDTFLNGWGDFFRNQAPSVIQLSVREAPWGLSDKLGWKQPADDGSRLFPLGGGGARRVRGAAPFAAGCRNALGNSAAAGRAYGRRRPRRGRPADGPGAGPQDGGSASAAAVRSSGRGMRATARVASAGVAFPQGRQGPKGRLSRLEELPGPDAQRGAEIVELVHAQRARLSRLQRLHPACRNPRPACELRRRYAYRLSSAAYPAGGQLEPLTVFF